MKEGGGKESRKLSPEKMHQGELRISIFLL